MLTIDKQDDEGQTVDWEEYDLGTFDSAREANSYAKRYPLQEHYNADSLDVLGADWDEKDGLVYTEYVIDGMSDRHPLRDDEPEVYYEKATATVTRERCEMARPHALDARNVWVVAEEGKDTEVYQSRVGAVKAIQRWLEDRNLDAKTGYAIEKDGLVGVRVNASHREEIVRAVPCDVKA